MAPIPITSAHPPIPALSYLWLAPIKPDKKKQINWTKVSPDTLASGFPGPFQYARQFSRTCSALTHFFLAVRNWESLPHSHTGIWSIFPGYPPSPTPSAKSRKQMTYASLSLRLPARSLSLKGLHAKSREQGSYEQSRAYDLAILEPASPRVWKR
jgi:hypothetical protein